VRLLSLSYNDISDAGAIALAAANNPKIQLLDLTYNHIGQKGLDALEQSVIPNVFTWGQDTTNLRKTTLALEQIKASHKKTIQLYCSKQKMPSSDELVMRLCQAE
jgi:hypothetical protein